METKCLASILSFIRSRGRSDHQYCKQIHSTDTDIYAVWKYNILQHCRVYCTMKQKLLNGIVLMSLLRLGQIHRGCHRVVWVQVKCGFGLELWADQACVCHWSTETQPKTSCFKTNRNVRAAQLSHLDDAEETKLHTIRQMEERMTWLK